jgi:hypothetical protein
MIPANNNKTVSNKLAKDKIGSVDLCSDCLRIGKCRLTLSENELEIIEAIESERRGTALKEHNKITNIMDDLSIENLVPLHVSGYKSLQYKNYLQPAYEAFHQKDYETAILNYRAILSKDPINKAALLGLAVALNFTHNYEDALNAMLDFSDLSISFLDFEEAKFIVHLRNCLKCEEDDFSPLVVASATT